MVEDELIFDMQGSSKVNGTNMEHLVMNCDNAEGSGTKDSEFYGQGLLTKEAWANIFMVKAPEVVEGIRAN